ncbi:Uncharacterised protein [Klebsiella pneumoniae]|nr:Uncharacterised protein [Klebsiella pneumoniae]
MFVFQLFKHTGEIAAVFRFHYSFSNSRHRHDRLIVKICQQVVYFVPYNGLRSQFFRLIEQLQHGGQLIQIIFFDCIVEVAHVSLLYVV